MNHEYYMLLKHIQMITAVSNNFAMLECTTKQVDVHACDKSIKPLLSAPVASGATAWDDPATDQTCVLVINEALCHGTKLDHSPIDPNQT